MQPIFDLEDVRAELDAEEWEDDSDGYCQTRRIYIGTVFSLVPSGKYYTPWANSNVDACPCCHGKGTLPGHKSARIRKRNQKRYENMLRLGFKNGRAYSIRHSAVRNAAHDRWQKVCSVCGGLGSKEAHEDEMWYDQAEEELSSINCSLESGDGDPCDLFITECRDIQEEEEDDEEAA